MYLPGDPIKIFMKTTHMRGRVGRGGRDGEGIGEGGAQHSCGSDRRGENREGGALDKCGMDRARRGSI